MGKYTSGGAAIGVILSVVSAHAADVGAASFPIRGTPAFALGWTGFYVGGSAGAGWGRSEWQYASFPGDTNHSASGALAGGQIGYNKDFGSVVLGVEADADWAHLRGTKTCPNPAYACATETRALSSLRGRIGYSGGAVMLFGTGGLGYGSVNYAVTSPGGPNYGYDSSRWGYAVGAGIEWGFAPNWSAKLEHVHYGLGGITVPVGGLSPTTTTNLKFNVDAVKLGVNYHFGWQ